MRTRIATSAYLDLNYNFRVLAAISEELLLHRAVECGLLTPQDLALATTSPSFDARYGFGPTLDALIHMGRISIEAIEQLRTELSQEQGRIVGSDHTLEGAQLETGRIGQLQTLDSAVARQPVTVSSSGSGFPVPNWDKYEFLDLLGRGGMGAVYRARDRRLDRIVALKFIHGDNPAQVQRFMQEARAQARLDHPHICKVFEVGVVDSKPYIAMQLVHGLPLDRASRAMTLLEKVQVMKDVAEAMHVAHEQGIIHRDLKPSNILITSSPFPDGSARYEPVVMDFGLARDSGAGGGLTESGDVLGTPAYMSPEQARGETRRMDRRTDVYSLGATLYDVLVGKPPFDDETVVNIILQVINEAPRPLRSINADMPEALELIVSKCLNKEAPQRYPTAKALADDLGRFLAAKRVEARRLGYVYRLGYFARRNKALTAAAIGLMLSLLGLLGFGVYARVMSVRKERLAKEEAALAEKLGQSVKDLEWLVRTGYLLPLHDTRREKSLVRERMDELTIELKKTGSVSAERLGAYVLGRGHLALHEWDAAQLALKRAEALGYRHPELDYALGRVFGERYSRALEEARKSGDKSFFEKRRKEIAAELLAPARGYLEKARTLRTVSTSYIEALVDFYDQHYDAALINAEMAHAREPWLYEASKLQGDVHIARALEARDHGDNDQAERHFAAAVLRYEAAAAIGHSDPAVHEAIAEAWIRQEEMDLYRGVDPAPKLRLAIEAADRAIEAAPVDSYGYTKKAFATYFQAQYVQTHGELEAARVLFGEQMRLGRQAIAVHPNDAYAHDIVGIGSLRTAQILSDTRQPIRERLTDAYAHFEEALRINPRFPWAYNDFGFALITAAADKMRANRDPRPELMSAVEKTRRAIALDDQYLFAYASLSAAYGYLGKWLMEHGQDPSRFLELGIEVSRAALKISGQSPFPYGNLGEFYRTRSQYQMDTGVDWLDATERSIQNFKEALKIDRSIVPAYGLVSMGYYSVAASRLGRGQDPASAIASGMEILRACYRIQPDFADCQVGEALLLMARARWEARQARPVTGQLAAARELARRGARQNENSEELQLALAEICYEEATVRSALKQSVSDAVAVGREATERALKLFAGWPRAQALQGAFLALQGAAISDGEARRKTRASARESLRAGLAENPLLKRRFEALLQGLER